MATFNASRQRSGRGPGRPRALQAVRDILTRLGLGHGSTQQISVTSDGNTLVLRCGWPMAQVEVPADYAGFASALAGWAEPRQSATAQEVLDLALGFQEG